MSEGVCPPCTAAFELWYLIKSAGNASANDVGRFRARHLDRKQFVSEKAFRTGPIESCRTRCEAASDAFVTLVAISAYWKRYELRNPGCDLRLNLLFLSAGGHIFTQALHIRFTGGDALDLDAADSNFLQEDLPKLRSLMGRRGPSCNCWLDFSYTGSTRRFWPMCSRVGANRLEFDYVAHIINTEEKVDAPALNIEFPVLFLDYLTRKNYLGIGVKIVLQIAFEH